MLFILIGTVVGIGIKWYIRTDKRVRKLSIEYYWGLAGGATGLVIATFLGLVLQTHERVMDERTALVEMSLFGGHTRYVEFGGGGYTYLVQAPEGYQKRTLVRPDQDVHVRLEEGAEARLETSCQRTRSKFSWWLSMVFESCKKEQFIFVIPK